MGDLLPIDVEPTCAEPAERGVARNERISGLHGVLRENRSLLPKKMRDNERAGER